MDKVRKYLTEFATVADQHYSGISWFEDRYNFFQKFFAEETLLKAEWPTFQEIGENLHSFSSLAIAKKNALGNPNHSIEHYRSAFNYLVRGNDPINVRINNVLDKESEYFLKYFGSSTISEVVGYAFPYKYVIYNRRDVEALLFLGITIEPTPGDKFGDLFIKYNEAIQPALEEYNKIVTQRTRASIPLEVDQFFSWLYEKYIIAIKSRSDIYFTIVRFLNQAQTENLRRTHHQVHYRNNYGQL